jgi:hypothetical protein
MGRINLLLALLVFTFVISETTKAQSIKEVGRDLTEKYFEVLELDVPNAMIMDGNDVWMTALPNNYDLDNYKSEVSELSNELGVQVMGEWVEQDNMIIYGLNYQGYSYAIIHMTANNMVAGMIQEGEVGPSEKNSTTTNNNSLGTWKTVERFSGSGTKNTQPFTVNSNEWRVVYESNASNSGMGGVGHIFQIFLLEPGQEMFEGEIIANETNKQSISGDSYVYKSGRFYFNSNSANGDWVIEVQVKQ